MCPMCHKYGHTTEVCRKNKDNEKEVMPQQVEKSPHDNGKEVEMQVTNVSPRGKNAHVQNV